MSKILLISTHNERFFENAYNASYQSILAEFFKNNAGIKPSKSAPDDHPEHCALTASEIYDLADVDFSDAESEAYERRLKIKDEGDIKLMMDEIEAKMGECGKIVTLSQEESDAVRNTIQIKAQQLKSDSSVRLSNCELKVAINDWRENYYRQQQSSIRGVTIEDAKRIELNKKTLYERCCLYPVEQINSEYKAYAVWQLSEPSTRTEGGSWPWVDALKSLFKSESNLEHLILLLHDRDLSEYIKSSFRCIQYCVDKTSIVVYQHTNQQFNQILQNNTSESMFRAVDNLISLLETMKQHNECNAVSQGYKELL